MAEPNSSKAQADRVLEVLGETVIIRGDAAVAVLDAAVIEEIVRPSVGAPRTATAAKMRSPTLSKGCFGSGVAMRCSTSLRAVSHCYPAIRSTLSRTLVWAP